MKNRTWIHIGSTLLLALSLGAVCPLRAAAASETLQEELRRSAVSAYLMETRGFFDSGAYEQYLDAFVNTDSPPVQNKEQDRTNNRPTVYMDFMGMDETVGEMGENPESVFPHRAFLSSLFYMEIPSDWHVGESALCPLVFCHGSDRDPGDLTQSGFLARSGFKEYYYDVFPYEGLLDEDGEEEFVAFVLDGGVNEALEHIMGQPVTEEFVIRQDSAGSGSGGGWFNVEKDGRMMAEFYVWTGGKVAVLPKDVQVKYKPAEDHGRIYVFQEWADQDFSTPEAIRDYVESGRADHLLEPVLGEGGDWECTEFVTEYHEFLRFEGDYEGRSAAFYIPVTPDYNENWVILFDVSEKTAVAENAYDIQERILKTFILQPYYYVVKKGDNLSVISKKFTDNPNNYYKIAQYKPNRDSGGGMDLDLIYPGQKIAIPLDLLFEKTQYK